MCLIIESYPQHRITFELMKDFTQRNDDGWGIMYQREPGAVPTVVKGFGLGKLWKTYCDLHSQHLDLYIHLRMRTHGDVKESNTHPYHVMDDLWLMHNGIISAPEVNKVRSDTWHWIEYILRPLLEQVVDRYAFIRSDAFAYVVEEYCGSSNRIVLMDSEGAVTYNDTVWHTIKATDGDGTVGEMPVGMRVSNTYAWTARPPAPVKAYTSKHESWKHYALPAPKKAEESAAVFCNAGAITREDTWDEATEDAAAWATAQKEAYDRACAKDDEAIAEEDAAYDEAVLKYENGEEGVENYELAVLPFHDQIRYLEKMTENELTNFVYEEPDAAAAILHYALR